FRLETASHPAVGAGSDHSMLGLTHLNDRFFLQRGSWTGLHACSTGDAIAFQESLRLAGHYPGREPLTFQREGKCALHFFTGPYTPAAYNALGRIVSEVRVGFVGRFTQMVGAAVATPHASQARPPSDTWRLAGAIGRTCQTLPRVVG